MPTEEHIIRGKDQLTPSLRRAGAATKNLRAQVGGLNTLIGVTAGLFAARAIVRGVGSTIEAFNKQDQAIAQVRQGILSTNQQAGRSLQELTKQARDFQKKTIFGDESILQGVTAQLLTFTKITEDNFDRTQKAVLDVTTRLFGADAGAESLRSTAIQLGKALNDPVANLGALGRSGIQFSKDQKETIKTLSEGGRLADAQAIILGELEKQYGGSAEAAAKAGAGGIKQFGNRLGDIQERIGGKLIPIINKLVKFLGKVLDFVARNSSVIKEIAVAIGIFVGVIGTVILAMKAWVGIQLLLNIIMTANPISLIIVGIAALIALVVTIIRKYDEWGAALTFILGPLGIIINIIQAFRRNWEDVKKSFTDGGILTGLKKIGAVLLDSLLMPLQQVLEIAKDIPGVGKFAGRLANKILKIREGLGVRTKKEEADKGKAAGAAAGAGVAGGLLPTGALAGAGTGGIGAGLSEVSARAPKNFVINIDSLIESLNINTQNITESASRVQEVMTEAILEALNDSQAVAR